MNRRQFNLQLFVPLLCLLVLLTLLATAPEDGHGNRETVEISVIWREDSRVWATVRDGMEQAGLDLGAELRFLAPERPNDAQEQARLLTRELEGGAQAVILDPADREILALPVSTGVVVTLETPMDQSAACVGPDAAALGQDLAAMVFNGVPAGGLALLLDSAPGDNGVRDRLESCQKALENAGRRVQICTVTPEEPVTAVVPELARRTGAGAIVAFEPSVLEEAAEAVRSLNESPWPRGQYPPLLYGFGSSPAIAAALEQSRVTALQAQNDFAAGYVAVETALGAIGRTGTPPPEPLPVFLVRRENMYDTERQKLLFPVS